MMRVNLTNLLKNWDYKVMYKSLAQMEVNELPKYLNDLILLFILRMKILFLIQFLKLASCGVPVIGSDAAGSVIERVIPEVNGYIFQIMI